jgi:hypothetical protein
MCLPNQLSELCRYTAAIPASCLSYLECSDCEGKGRPEGVYGLLYASPGVGRVPFERFYCASNGDHIETAARAEETDPGCNCEAVIGYAPSP